MSSAPRPTIIQTAESILKIERSKWIYHERALAKRLGLSVDHLRGFMQSVTSGSGVPPPYDTAIDLNSGVDNILNLHRIQHGQKTNACNTEEPSLDAVAGLSTYYQIGRKESRDSRVNMKVQIDLIKMVTGTHSALDKFGAPYKMRRQEIWRGWIDDSDSITAALYKRDHLPWIALHYHRLWDITILPTTKASELSNAVLELVKEEIVNLFVKMFIIPSSALDRFTVLRRSRRISVDMEIEPASSRKRKHSPGSDDDSLDGDDDDEEDLDLDGVGDGNEDQGGVMSRQLDKRSLKTLWDNGEYKRVGSLEIAAKEAHAGNDLRSVNAKITMLGGTAISIAEFDAIKGIRKSTLGRKIMYFADVKQSHHTIRSC